MAIDFTFTKAQRDLQVQSRKFARDVLAGAATCETLATPEERFVATKPIYEAMVAAGYLRKCIPAPGIAKERMSFVLCAVLIPRGRPIARLP